MKRYILCLALISIASFFCTSSALAETKQPALDSLESISSFHTDIEVQTDGMIHVTETISYDFGRLQRHGLVRTVPLTDAVGTFDKLVLSNLQVTDEVGNLYDFTTDGLDTSFVGMFFSAVAKSSDEVTIKIGNPGIYVTGEMTYIISYDVKNALGYFDDRTEIYWNTTGQEWLVPIRSATVRVTVPQDQTKGLAPKSYCGIDGAKTECLKQETFYDEKEGVTKVTFVSNGELASGEGMTVAVPFSKDLIDSPSKSDRLLRDLLHFLSSYGGYIIVLILTPLWFKKAFQSWLLRRRYYQEHTIIAEYDAGEVTPLMAGSIIRGYSKSEDISAQIVHLAVLGYLQIEKQDKIYLFKACGKDAALLSQSEQLLLQTISDKTTDDLKLSFKSAADLIKKEEIKNLVRDGYIHKGWNKSPLVVFVGMLFVAFNPGMFIWLLVGTQAGIAFSGTAVLIAFITIIFRPRPQSLTLKGLEIERNLLGLKLYIEVAEAERINFHNAPEKSPELFEKLLPYAMVFGLEEKWAKEFEGIYTAPPAWYAGTDNTNFSSALFATQLGQFSSITATAMGGMRASGSSYGSSGSFSGSSGGGFSGGGGGGGGGRSW